MKNILATTLKAVAIFAIVSVGVFCYCRALDWIENHCGAEIAFTFLIASAATTAFLVVRKLDLK